MAREPSIEKMLAVAKKHAPKGWTLDPTGIDPSEGDGIKTIAYVDYEAKLIVHPPIVNRSALAVFLHECGHVHHKHSVDHSDLAVETEWEAEMYAWRAMRAAGIPVPRSAARGLRTYLRNIFEHLYAEPGVRDEQYANCVAEVPDHIMRFIYGANWRSCKGRPE